MSAERAAGAPPRLAGASRTTVPLRLSGALFSVFAGMLLGGATACDSAEDEGKNHQKVEEAEASPLTLPRCTPTKQSRTLGEPSELGSDAGDSNLRLPFAPELGSAVHYPGGFAVGLLATTEGQTRASLVLLPYSGDVGEIVNFGRTHGPVGPPQLDARGRNIVVGIVDNDAAGNTVRLARVSTDTRTPAWGPDFPQGRDDSSAFALSLGQNRGLLVWDDLHGTTPVQGVLRAVSFEPQTLEADEPFTLPWKDIDVEAPKLSARHKSGFWLGALRAEPAKPAGDGDTLVESLAHDPQHLVAAKLDERGRPLGAPLAVSEPTEPVLAFDMATNARGEAVFVWRSDNLPGVEASSAVRLARVAEDGSVHRTMVKASVPTLGIPSLLKSSSQLWLALGAGKRWELAQVGKNKPKLMFEAPPALAAGEPLALSGKHLLVSQPRGRQLELTVARCP